MAVEQLEVECVRSNAVPLSEELEADPSLDAPPTPTLSAGPRAPASAPPGETPAAWIKTLRQSAPFEQPAGQVGRARRGRDGPDGLGRRGAGAASGADSHVRGTRKPWGAPGVNGRDRPRPPVHGAALGGVAVALVLRGAALAGGRRGGGGRRASRSRGTTAVRSGTWRCACSRRRTCRTRRGSSATSPSSSATPWTSPCLPPPAARP